MAWHAISSLVPDASSMSLGKCVKVGATEMLKSRKEKIIIFNCQLLFPTETMTLIQCLISSGPGYILQFTIQIHVHVCSCNQQFNMSALKEISI